MSDPTPPRASFDSIVSELASDERVLSSSEKSLLARIFHHGQAGTAPAEAAAFMRHLRRAVDGAISERVMRLIAAGVTERAFGTTAATAAISPLFPEPLFPPDPFFQPDPFFKPDPFFHARAKAEISPMFPEPMFPGPLFPPDPFFHAHATQQSDISAPDSEAKPNDAKPDAGKE